MFPVTQYDVLRGLKKFRRLAKQDVLASAHTSDPTFWSAQAEARRSTYSKLMEYVEKNGVEAAYQMALEAYAALPLTIEEKDKPAVTGIEQAHEMFFTILGLSAQEIARIRLTRRRRRLNEATRQLVVGSAGNAMS